MSRGGPKGAGAGPNLALAVLMVRKVKEVPTADTHIDDKG